MSGGTGPIGVFDSGYGGLTVLKSIVTKLPQYDYCYLGDNARAPYGNRSFDTVYRYTLQAVRWFFSRGCPLVILACNTASAKALRNIQQKDLPGLGDGKRVLGVIRPTAEQMGHLSKSGHVGVLATTGTVLSGSYELEIKKLFPALEVHQQACPMWVPLIENGETSSAGAQYFIEREIRQLMSKEAAIDTVLLACTHYPLLTESIAAFLPEGVKLVSQGDIVADSLADYLQRHPEMERRLSKQGVRNFFTTDDPADFDRHATRFFGEEVRSERLEQLLQPAD